MAPESEHTELLAESIVNVTGSPVDALAATE
jgi:hypothetical protein